jgi:hypothetical protein
MGDVVKVTITLNLSKRVGVEGLSELEKYDVLAQMAELMQRRLQKDPVIGIFEIEIGEVKADEDNE